MFHVARNHILGEISAVLSRVNPTEVDQLLNMIIAADKIVTCGAGRMGMMARAFAMRLGHLNLCSYHIQDCNVPRIGEKDLLVVCSGSGETKTILSLAEAAQSHHAPIALVTARQDSSIARLATVRLTLAAPTKESTSISSVQPMTSLTEQSCLIFFDTLVLMLMERLQQTSDMLKNRHSILE